jgi:hypothetical protein|nr:MAG TPA: hypothetical protein [Caudoviricetes sp.]
MRRIGIAFPESEFKETAQATDNVEVPEHVDEAETSLEEVVTTEAVQTEEPIEPEEVPQVDEPEKKSGKMKLPEPKKNTARRKKTDAEAEE